MRPVTALFRRGARDERGAVALEFTFIAPFFLGLLLAILELGWVLFQIHAVDDAVSQASRYIYIGHASQGSIDQSALESFICDTAAIIPSCEENIALEAFAIGDFSATPGSDAVCRDGAVSKVAPVTSYTPGGSTEIMLLRACVTVNLFFPFNSLGLDLATTDSGRFQIVSSTAFANEPF